MEDYLSEREQIEQVRKVAAENAPWAIAGVLIGVGLLVGWQQWHAWQSRQSLAASALYTQSLDLLARGDVDAASKLAQRLRADYARTPYADLSDLALARFDVEAGKLPEAEKYLAGVMNGSKDLELRLVARLRLARVQRDAGRHDAALATLAGANPGSFAPAYAEVRGDVLYDKGDRAGALAAYREADASKSNGLVNRELLALKLADLGGLPPPAAQPGTATVVPAAANAPAAAPAPAGAAP